MVPSSGVLCRGSCHGGAQNACKQWTPIWLDKAKGQSAGPPKSTWPTIHTVLRLREARRGAAARGALRLSAFARAEHRRRRIRRHEVAAVLELDVRAVDVLVELAVIDAEEVDEVSALTRVAEARRRATLLRIPPEQVRPGDLACIRSASRRSASPKVEQQWDWRDPTRHEGSPPRCSRTMMTTRWCSILGLTWIFTSGRAKLQRRADAFIASEAAEATISQRSNLRYYLSMLIVEKLHGGPIKAPSQLKNIILAGASVSELGG